MFVKGALIRPHFRRLGVGMTNQVEGQLGVLLRGAGFNVNPIAFIRQGNNFESAISVFTLNQRGTRVNDFVGPPGPRSNEYRLSYLKVSSKSLVFQVKPSSPRICLKC